jgi:predicted phage tail component-like protein
MNFDSNDLSSYDLTVKKSSISSFLPPIKTSYVDIADKAYDFRAFLQPRLITVDVVVTGTGESDLISNLDAVSKILNPAYGVKKLVLDFPDDRYYNAKVNGPIDWQVVTYKLAMAQIGFVCPDPHGYANSQTDSNHSINADPKTVVETTGGTAYVEPVYTLTAGENLTSITLKVENINTEEELQWQGSLNDTEELEIDAGLWIVKKEGTADMADASGQFPRLLPDQDNSIKVTGFGSLGSMNIVYRDTYL